MINTTEFFTREHHDRIVGHMNDDHSDALLGYARAFGNSPQATAARMLSIDAEGMSLQVTTAAGEAPVRVLFEPVLTSPEEAHHRLIAMAKAASAAGTGKDDARIRRAKEAADFLLQSRKTVLLATASAGGEPDCSVAPLFRAPTGQFVTYISELSQHTSNLRTQAQASVLLIEDEATAAHLLARRRITLSCSAEFIERDHPMAGPAFAGFRESYGQVMQHLESLTDFHLVLLTPHRARLVAGFGQAYDVDPADWHRLNHVGDTGHQGGHRGQRS